ncbi:SPARC-related modular calcium-binding protein 1-like isoform X2 [Dendronephthya gigantea]|uniref:SPARC-related modular calcium-binding protein 1-like isoform X2 n=1 Tax=Dendronephthya gigantea TaxID=151771 RepID=UPI00106A3C75|nr:SPARC-related modular calcium-binding protein 1-like isoform X2 [Dendronephthya gigantea]
MAFSACFIALLVEIALTSLVLARSSSDCEQVCNAKDFSRQVCGSDGETYQSKCVLRLKKCTTGKKLYVEYEGACRAPPSCSEDRKRVLKSIKDRQLLRIGIYIPECDADGSYSEVQCSVNRRLCWCVNKYGVEVDDTRVAGKRPDCRFRRGIHQSNERYPSNERFTRILKGCSKDNRISFNKKVMASFKKEMAGRRGKLNAKGIAEWKISELDADNNGFLSHRELRTLIKRLKRAYSPRKCGKTFFYFCDENQDYKVSKKEWLVCLGIRETQDTPQCFNQKARARKQQTKNPSTTVFIPQCNKDGTYKTVQCELVSKYCWCVHSVTGRNIPNTSVQNAQPDCSKPTRRIRPATSSPQSHSIKRLSQRRTSPPKSDRHSVRNVKVRECDDTSWQKFCEELLKMLRTEMETLTKPALEGNSTLPSGNGQNLFWALSRRLPDAMITAWKFSQLDVDKDSLMVNDELFSSHMKKTFGQIRRGRKCSKKLAVFCDFDRNGGLSLDEWRRCLGNRTSRTPGRGFILG